jgi:DNA-binding winged helix-turn-helix (wHTH) protein/tetratricopeptide (TPR) repeat protein
VAPVPIRFAEFILDPANARLTRHGREVRLRPKTFDVLRCLVERRGTLVTKDALLAAVWPGIAVGDANLQLCLSEIRKALGDDPRSPRFVDTVHRRGYRFRVAGDPHSPDTLSAPSPGADATEGGRAARPIVGRARELELLTGLLREAAGGRRQTVFVSGEAGIGKTALVETFLAGSVVRESCWLARGQCVTRFGPEVAYLPMLDALATLAAEPSSRVLEVLRAAAPAWLVQMPGLTTPLEREALAPAASATGERRIRELAVALETLAEERPLVLWLDDMHDSDTSTLEIVDYLARRKPPARLLVIGTYRPSVLAVPGHPLRRIALGLRERALGAELPLSALGVNAVEDYLRARLGGPAEAIASLAHRVHARTEGNPLFVVHVTDALLTGGTAHDDHEVETWVAAIPATLADMLRAQIEILPEAEREALEVASVVGMRVAVQTIDALHTGAALDVETVLERLAHAYRFLEPDGVDDWPDGTRAVMYRFRHALHQEVAYAQIPARRRADLHRRVAYHREQTHAQDVHAVAVDLSSHFERGHDEARAVHYCLVGFEQALQRSAFSEGLKLATRGLALLPRVPGGDERDSAELRLQMAAVVSYGASRGAASPEAREACRRALELCRQAEDSPELFPALCGLFAFYLVNGQYETAQEVGARMMRLAEAAQRASSHGRPSPQALVLAANVALGMVLWHLGRLDEASDHFSQRLRLYTPNDHLTFLQFGHDPAVTSLSFAAPVAWYRGYPDTARRTAEEGITLGRTLAHAYSQGVALLFGARAFQESGDLARVAALVDEHEAVCRDQGFVEADARRDLSRGWLLVRQGHVHDGIASLTQGLRICDAGGTVLERSYHLTVLADAHGRAGSFDEGLRMLDEAMVQSRSTAEAYYVPEMYRLRGQILWRLLQQAQNERRPAARGHGAPSEEPVDAIEAALQEAMHRARAQNGRGLELRAAVTLVQWRMWCMAHLDSDESCIRSARLDQAYHDLSTAYAWFTEGFDTRDIREARALLDASPPARTA